MMDRVGLGWRPELAAGILSNLERIDVLEVIGDDYFDSSARAQAVRTLAAQRPVVLHGVGLGPASTVRVEEKRLAKMARLVEKVRPEGWSEHLAFVRAGDIEIGHLAAPPRTQATIDGTAANLDRARPGESLERLPLDRVHQVHISGGRWIGDTEAQRRLLDDHLHDPPDPVYDLLAELARMCPNPLTVILERDGSYPPMGHLLAQLDRARRAMARGRAEKAAA